MDQSKRRDIVTKAAKRIIKNIEALEGYSKQVYVEKLVDQLDDLHLIALDFAIEMTPGIEGANDAK